MASDFEISIRNCQTIFASYKSGSFPLMLIILISIIEVDTEVNFTMIVKLLSIGIIGHTFNNGSLREWRVLFAQLNNDEKNPGQGNIRTKFTFLHAHSVISLLFSNRKRFGCCSWCIAKSGDISQRVSSSEMYYLWGAVRL